MDVKVERLLGEPFFLAETVLRAGPEAWVPRLEEDGSGGLVTELEVETGPVLINRRVVLRVGRPTYGPGRCTVPIQWQAEHHPDAYPKLGGVLELTSAPDGRALLALDVSYQPPAGVLGELMDRAVMHRVAEAALQGFLARAARVIELRVRRNAGRAPRPAEPGPTASS